MTSLWKKSYRSTERIWFHRKLSFESEDSLPSDITKMPLNSPSENHTNVQRKKIWSKYSCVQHYRSLTACIPKMIISISIVQISSGWIPSFKSNFSKTGERSVIELSSLWDFRIRSLHWAWRTYFPMTLKEKTESEEVVRENLNLRKEDGSYLLIEHVTSLEKLSGERCQEESPNLKSSFTAAHILVGRRQRVYKFRCFGRWIVTYRLQKA